MTCICIERDGGDAITRIVRTDDSRLPAVIFSRPPHQGCGEAAGHPDSDSEVTFSSKNTRQVAGQAAVADRKSIACQTEDGSSAADLSRLVADQTKTIAALEAEQGNSSPYSCNFHLLSWIMCEQGNSSPYSCNFH